jgi:hypothetical protein
MIEACCGPPVETQIELGSNMGCQVTSKCYGCANKDSASSNLASRLVDWNKSQLG